MAPMNNNEMNMLAGQSKAFPLRDAPLMTFLSLAPTSSAPYTPKPERTLPERRPSSGFLSLAPTVSASYPLPPRSRQQSVTHLTRPLPLTHGPTPEAAIASTPPSVASSVVMEPKHRRSSSMSSDGSSSTGKSRLRFLKLGPVHWGEHQGDHKEDWHEIDEDAIAP